MPLRNMPVDQESIDYWFGRSWISIAKLRELTAVHKYEWFILVTMFNFSRRIDT